jgi:hypothetical protein
MLPDIVLVILVARTAASAAALELDALLSMLEGRGEGSGGGVVLSFRTSDAGEFEACALLGLLLKNGVMGLLVTETLKAS